MPVKNAAPWLEECILSIQNQTFADWQLLAVDDFSTDTSWEILQNFRERDNRISVLKNKTPGITNALQLAFENSTGNYISRMDADDVMPPNKLEILLISAQENQDAIITGFVKYFGDSAISDGYRDYQNWLNARVKNADFEKHIFRECVLASPNWLTHRKNIKAVLPFSAHTYPEDYDLVFRWIEKGVGIIGVKAETHWWREHQKRTSRTSKLYNQQRFFNLKLSWFLKLKYSVDKTIVVFGENSKAEICTRFFEKQQIPFRQLTKSTFEELKHISNPLLLCTIYGDEQMNLQLENFFKQNELVLGESWWFV